MPDLHKLLKERNVKKFTKRAYRPWDLSGEESAATDNPLSDHSPLTKEENFSNTNPPEENANSLLSEIKSTIESNKVSNEYHSDINLDIKEIPIGYHLDNAIDSNKESIRYPLDIQSDINKIPDQFYDFENTSTLSTEKIEIEDEEISILKIQPVDESLMALEQEIISLSGKQKIIFETVVEICSARNNSSTGPVQTASLASVAQTTTGTIKTMLMRLIKKKLLIRFPGKNAKGGYVNLGVTPTILDLVNSIKESNKQNLFVSDLIIANRYQKGISQEYISSNSNYINTTTNLNRRSEQIPPEWENINFDPLTHIGFSKTQIKQIVEKNDPEVVQESINHFAFGLEHNSKVKKYDDPLNVLMGVLRKGQGWVEKDYRSAIEIAQEKLFQNKRAELERKKSLEEEAFKLALSEWDSGITEEERKKITVRTNGDLTPPNAKLSKYFRDHVWQEKKHEYLLF